MLKKSSLEDRSILIKLSRGSWYYEVPLPPYLIPCKKPLELYEKFSTKDLIRIDALCIISRDFVVYGRVSLKDVKSGSFKLTDKDDIVIVEEKPELSYKALGQILVYKCLLEAVWHAHVRKLLLLRSSPNKELLPSEQAVVYACKRISDEIGKPIKIFDLATNNFIA